jgi:aminopeptidase N
MLVVPSLACAVLLGAATPVVHHDLSVRIDVRAQRIDVVDAMSLDRPRTTVDLVLHAGMAPSVEGARIEVTRLADSRRAGGAVPAERVRATFPQPVKSLVVRYGGVIVHPPAQLATEHQRSFQETPGTIDARGVYLSAASLWFPRVADDDSGRALALVTARVAVTGLPRGWRALSEGDAAGEGVWLSTTPSDDLHIVAGPFTELRDRKAGVDLLVWLRSDSGRDDGPALAQRYFEVTGQYLKLYGELIGPYPYGKFALVENFWETGYGMASFTLLGPQVIRFPFILHTSWPHELLHNWWGNGVFVEGGNWSEGLTAYLADHYTAEREGRGDEHRRAALQKYQDFVGPDPSLDFPLAEFGSRFSAASEAVGYGKWMMVVHMLRVKLGDEAFISGLRKLWSDHRFERASFADVQAAFQAQTAEDLGPFFHAWLKSTGAPRLRWKSATQVKDRGGALRLELTLEQAQRGAPLPLEVPVVVTLADGRATSAKVSMSGREARASVPLEGPAARLDIDPFVDVFRELLPGEVAPSMSRALGARRALFVMPTLASSAERAGWQRFMKALCGDAVSCRAVDDKDVDALPTDAAIWILGYGNQLRASAVATASRYGARLDDRGFLSPGPWSIERLRAERTDPSKTSLALAGPHPRNERLGLAFVAAHNPKAIDALARKIPHYGKYGYLGFTGDGADNSIKGQWQADAAPLTVFFGDKRPALTVRSGPPLRPLPPPFEGERMLGLVFDLARLNGRANRSKDLEAALALVEHELTAAGLSPRRQCPVAGVCNVIAHIPGKEPSLARVVLGAHVDHLGRVKGSVHPGADDNASGVAVLLEVARSLARGGPFARSVDIVAFSGEEEGLVGSRGYVKALHAETGDARDAVHSMVNLDTVGRRTAGGRTPALLVLDGHSAAEWVHVFRGVGFTTGVRAELAREGGGASDQQAFLEAGIPAVQLFGGPHPDYHRKSDTPDKVSASSLVETAVIAREVMAYLASRKEPLTPAGASAPTASGGGARRASLGTVPDMTFTGPGVRVDDVVAGSPAAALGLRRGDVLVRFGGAAIDDLRAYSELLKSKKPGDRTALTIVREGKELSFEVVLAER